MDGLSAQSNFQYNDEQLSAIQAMLQFLDAGGHGSFLLSGSAGTGKTSCVREVRRRWLHDIPGNERLLIAFTAPTNKATKVLRQSLPAGSVCCTTYSLLGLRMDSSGEVKTIVQAGGRKEPPIASADAVVVDEGSMVNQLLFKLLMDAAKSYRIPVIFMGDPAQLPPVKELSSPIWAIEQRAHLSKVMRHDNQILTLAQHIRSQVDKPFPNYAIRTDCDLEGGVQKLSRYDFDAQIRAAARAGAFATGHAKAIAWRNVIVGRLNQVIRQEMKGITPLPYAEGDRIIALSPCMQSQETLLHTDDEAVVESVSVCMHPKHVSTQVMRLKCLAEDESPVTLYAIHPDSAKGFNKLLKDLADAKNWKKFWATKEDFHDIRHAYAITAHRSQGSTYKDTYVDYSDILHNPNKPEAARCLYVACTRASKNLILTGG
jgi:exodeoxyribonuclease-5